MRRYISRLAIVALAVTLIACGSATAQGYPQPDAARVFIAGGPDLTPTAFATEEELPPEQAAGLTLTMSVIGGGAYHVGNWLPVQVTVQNDGPDMAGEVRVSTSRSGANYAAALDLPHGSRKSTTVYTLITSFSRRLTVRLLRGEQAVAQQQLVVQPYMGSDRLVGVLTDDARMVRLPANLPDQSHLVAVPLALKELPDRAAGLSSFVALVLEDVSVAELSEEQRATLREWVTRGGHLVIGGGVGAQRTLAGLPEELRPVQLGGVTQAAADTVLPGLPAGTGEVAIAQAIPVSGAAGVTNQALAPQAGTQLLFERPLGRGVISFFALSLDDPSLAVWERAALFWGNLLPQPAAIPPGFGPNDISLEQMIEGNIAASLTRLPALELPSLSILGLLLLFYILLAGPITYLVLRWTDRQVLGWVIVPGLTLIFAAAAYGLGYAQRGGDVVLNQVSLIEPLDEGTARVRSFAGIFSPRRNSYTLDISGNPLLKPISLQGPWDTSEQGGVFQQQHASALDVPQWAMRAVVADTVQPFSGLKAHLALKGAVLEGEVVNDTSQTVRDVVLIQDVNVTHVGDLAPGERRSIGFTEQDALATLARRRQFGGAPLSYLIYNELIDMAGQQGGKPLPPEIQLRQALLDSLYAPGLPQRSAAPMLLGWADTPPLEINVAGQRVARQQITLIAMEPQLSLADDPVSLHQGWLQRSFVSNDTNNNQTICMGSRGIGANLLGQPVIQMLTLPRILHGLRASELTLMLSADGPWPQNTQVELFNWEGDRWVEQPFADDTPLLIEQPEQFLSPDNGQIKARISGQIDPQMGGGCIYLDANVKGVVGSR